MALVSVPYGDSMRRDLTGAIEIRHVDSRNRADPLATTPSTYTVPLGTQLERVRTIQVGDAQLPTDARNAVDYSRRHYQVSEPLRLGATSTLSVQETVKVYDRTSGALVSTTTNPTRTVVFPATLNHVASSTGNNVTFSAAHAMDAVLAYWPSTLPAYLVGSRAVNYQPTLTAATLDATTPFPSTTTVTLSAAAVTALLAHTTGPLAALADVVVGADDTAWLYVPPLTVPEWVAVLNDALADLSADGALTQRYAVRLNATTGLVELQLMGGDRLSRTQRVETVTTFTVSANDVMWRLGFPSGAWVLKPYKSMAYDATGARASTAPYVLAVVPRDARTVQLVRGTYAAAADLAAQLTTATNGLYVPEAWTAAQRQLHFTDATGAARALLVPVGKYSAAQMAAFLESGMNASPTVSGQFVVTTAAAAASAASAAGSTVFTIADGAGRPFSLDFGFAGADSALLAGLLGFEAVKMIGAASYTSSLQGPVAASTATSDPDLHVVVTWAADTARTRLRATAGPPLSAFEGTVGAAVSGNTYNLTFTLLGSAGATNVAHHSMPNDVLTFSDGTNAVTAVVASAPDGDVGGATPIQWSAVNFGAALLGAGDDLDSTATLTVTPTTRPDFVLHMAPFPRALRLAAEDTTGSGVVNMTLPRPLDYVGQGVAYGPVAEQLGFAPTVTQSSASGVALADNAYSLDPPEYVFLALLEPTAVSQRAVFRPTVGQDDRTVLAKFIVTNGYARITEESTHVTATSALTVKQVTVAWVNPDGTLVDWNGRDHSYSLLFRVHEGVTYGAAT